MTETRRNGPADGGRMRVTVGRIGRPHGTGGEMTVRPDSDFPQRFQPSSSFHTDHPDFPTLVLRAARPGPKGLLVSFAGVTTRQAAARLTGCELWIKPQERRALEPGEFWPDSLVGLAVRMGDEEIGRVTDMVTGRQDRLVVTRRDGAVAEVPFVESLIPEINLAGGWLRMEDFPGLFPPPDGSG